MTRLPRLLWPLLATLFAAPAATQVLKGHDSNAPVSLDADRIEVQDRADRVVVTGNVNMVQAGMRLNADRLTVAYTRARGTGDIADPDINRIDATGNVVVTRGDQTARGGAAVYDLNRRIITMFGNVQLTQGANRLNGGRVVIDLNTGLSTLDGRAAASGMPGAPASSGGGRVTGTFTVPQRSNPQ